MDTTAINPAAKLMTVLSSSGKTRITERIRRTGRTHLQIDTAVEDPVLLKVPWPYSRIYEKSDGAWFEQHCENNRDGYDREPDLTPPK